jgi:TPR repeat protein
MNIQHLMLDSVQNYLMRTVGKLSPLQAVDLCLYGVETDEAKSIASQYLALAQKDDEHAMAMAASFYRAGWGVEADESQAFAFAKAAAKNGFGPGLAELGYCYEDGIGTAKNAELGLINLSNAAGVGYSTAALHLAVRFAEGIPYGQSSEKAVIYAKLAYELGDGYAAHLLGTWYEEGTLVAKDLGLALMWFKNAAERGSQLACLRMATAYANGELGLAVDTDRRTQYLNQAASATNP